MKGAKIEPRKGDGNNQLACVFMFGEKLIFHLIAFKRQKKVDRKYKKILLLVIADQRFPTYFLSSWEFFLLKLEKKSVTRKF